MIIFNTNRLLIPKFHQGHMKSSVIKNTPNSSKYLSDISVGICQFSGSLQWNKETKGAMVIILISEECWQRWSNIPPCLSPTASTNAATLQCMVWEGGLLCL